MQDLKETKPWYLLWILYLLCGWGFINGLIKLQFYNYPLLLKSTMSPVIFKEWSQLSLLPDCKKSGIALLLSWVNETKNFTRAGWNLYQYKSVFLSLIFNSKNPEVKQTLTFKGVKLMLLDHLCFFFFFPQSSGITCFSNKFYPLC